MENKKGQGIFLGVVGVATLVVAIIGATFAYFSATVTGTNDVNLEAYRFSASLVIDDITGAYDNQLIPLYPSGDPTDEGYTEGSNSYLLAAVNDTKKEGICVDENGYQVCALIRATFTNNGSTAITLNGAMTATANGFENLKIAELTGTEGAFTAVGTANPAPTTGNSTGLPLSQAVVRLNDAELGTTNTVVKYFVVYLNDIGSPQEAEMGATFTGEITYTSDVGGAQLTGQFTL